MGEASDREALLAELRAVALECRKDIIRMLEKAGSGHPGGSLSIIDLLVTLYFGGHLKHRPDDPAWEGRDRFVLSKGHGVPALYAVLARRGYFDPARLDTLRQIDSELQGHPANSLLPAVEASTGSLGQGLSIALGMALASRMDGNGSRVYCLIGDGESQEGQIWEAALAAAKFGLDNLVVFLDANRGQLDGATQAIMPMEPFVDKWAAFGWRTLEIDGHDPAAILDALDAAAESDGRPVMLVARTLKGKGVSFMEEATLAGDMAWHGSSPNAEQAARALAELDAAAP